MTPGALRLRVARQDADGKAAGDEMTQHGATLKSGGAGDEDGPGSCWHDALLWAYGM